MFGSFCLLCSPVPFVSLDSLINFALLSPQFPCPLRSFCSLDPPLSPLPSFVPSVRLVPCVSLCIFYPFCSPAGPCPFGTLFPLVSITLSSASGFHCLFCLSARVWLSTLAHATLVDMFIHPEFAVTASLRCRRCIMLRMILPHTVRNIHHCMRSARPRPTQDPRRTMGFGKNLLPKTAGARDCAGLQGPREAQH